MEVAEMETTIFDAAREMYGKGPGFAQESVVLREVADRIKPQSIDEEQSILSTWQRLFQTGQLAWGYNLDNPGRPWYHVPSAEGS